MKRERIENGELKMKNGKRGDRRFILDDLLGILEF